jgi:amino acid adenylation domain-containing protein
MVSVKDTAMGSDLTFLADGTVQSRPPRFGSLDAWFNDAVANHPHSIALAFYGEADLDTPRLLTYQELGARVNQLAERLAGTICSPHPHVGLHFSHSIELIVATLAILRVGGVFVPLDPNLPEERLRFIMEDSGVEAVLTDAAHAERFRHDTERLLLVDAEPMVFEPSKGLADVSKPSAEDAAYLLYTSGTTGRPKGVVIEHGSIVQQVAAFADILNFRQGDSFLLTSGISFDIWVDQLLVPLLFEGTLVVASQSSCLLADTLSAIVARSGVNHIYHAPRVWRSLLDQGWQGAPFVRALSGGEAMPANLARDLRERCASVYNLYGPTEATICTLGCRLDAIDKTIPLGRPLETVEVRILDPDSRPVPDGAWGELWVGGPFVGRGYHRRPELSAEHFRPDPLGILPECRFYRTGDRVRLQPDGMLEFGGRFDDQIKIHGVRIEIQEIEASILDYPGVKDALVQTRNRADGLKSLIAYAVPEAGTILQPDQIRDYLASRLMSAMVPARLLILEEWPIGPTGKVARERLPVPPEEPSPAQEGTEGGERVGPFLELVGEVLRRPIRDDGLRFVDLGGTSLEAMLLVARVQQRFAASLDITSVLGEANLAELAHAVGAHRVAQEEQPADIPAREVLSFAEERFWLLSRVYDDPALLNLTFTFQIEQEFDAASIERAWSAVLVKHDALRTIYPSENGVPRALVQDQITPVIVFKQHDCASAEEADALVAATAIRERKHSFDLEQGPLARMVILQCRDGATDFIITLHHIIADGWSINIITSDLIAALDTADQSGLALMIAAEPKPYREVTARSRYNWEQHDREPALAYWRAQLEEGIPWLDLPVDRPLKRGPTSNAAVHALPVEGGLLDRLADIARGSAITPWALLLGSLYALIHRHSLAGDLVIGSAVHGRSLPRDEHIVGAFLNVLPVRVKVDGSEPFRTLARRVQHALMGAYAHQDAPIDAIISATSGRDVLGDALQVYFNVLDFPQTAGTTGTPQARLGELIDPVARFDLTFYAQRLKDGILLHLVHSLDLLDHSTGEMITTQWHRLLEQIAIDPDQSISAFRLLERGLPDAVSQPPRGDRDRAVAEVFSEIAAAHPDLIAVDDGRLKLTYEELSARAGALARILKDRADTAEGVVGLCCGHNASMVVVVLACAFAGVPYVPIDPRHPALRCDHVVRDSRARLLIATEDEAAAAQQLADRHGIGLVVVRPDTAGRAADGAAAPPDPATPLYILYTSGSTGQPKGVLQSQENVVHHARVYAKSVAAGPGRRLALIASYTFDAAVMDLFGALLSGATLQVIDIADDFGLSRLSDRLRAMEPDVLHATPTIFRYLMKVSATAFDFIETVVLGGEPATLADLELFRERFPADAVLINGFGPTESTTALQARYPSGRKHESEALSIGHPVPNTDVLLEDSERRDNEVAGEIVIRSRYLALGYWRKAEETARAFGTLDDGSDLRIYRTGDFGRRLASGEIVHTGRRDDQVKLRGQRIELGEIEAVLGSFPGVDRAVCVLRREVSPQIVAFVIGPSADMVSRSGEAWLSQRLPPVMVPARIIAMTDLPRTVTGKIDRLALATLNLPELEICTGVTSSGSAWLELVRAIWSDVLNIRDVPAGSTFIDLGGDSLALARVQAKLEQRIGAAIPLRRLARFLTAEAIASHLDQLGIAELADAGKRVER